MVCAPIFPRLLAFLALPSQGRMPIPVHFTRDTMQFTFAMVKSEVLVEPSDHDGELLQLLLVMTVLVDS